MNGTGQSVLYVKGQGTNYITPILVVVVLVVCVYAIYSYQKRQTNEILEESERKQRDAIEAVKKEYEENAAKAAKERKEAEAREAEEQLKIANSFKNISKKRGHPLVKKDQIHIPYNGTWHSVRPGRAKTEEVCWEHAKLNNIPSWGWRKHDKSCWHYMDSILLSEPTHPGTEANHIVGCTKPGVSVDDGCIDFKAGHTVWGHRAAHLQVPGVVNQWYTIPNTGKTKMTNEKCRELGKKEGIKAVGYRTNLHPANEWKATCWGYDDENTTKGWSGNASDVAHITMCTDKSKKVREGC